MNEAWIKMFGHRHEPKGDCWIFIGAAGTNGYGHVGYMKRNWTAHRLSLTLATGQEVPPGCVVMHSCDTPACINPAHLRAATPSENTRDMVAKRRHGWVTKPAQFKAVKPVPMFGEQNPSAKLSYAKVLQIRADRAAGLSYSALIKRHGVAKSTLAGIVRGESWKEPGRTAEEVASVMESVALSQGRA